MFGISMWEFGLIALVALILLGPRQLAETAKVAGKMYREILKLAGEVRSTVDLDSLTSTPGESRTKPETTHPGDRYADELMAPAADRKSGPDFYADLLESSQRSEETDKKADEATQAQGSGDRMPSGEQGSGPPPAREK